MSLAIESRLLGQLSEREVLRSLQQVSPLSRAEVSRHSGLTAPTVSKAVASLLGAGLLEEFEAVEGARGRPAKKLRLANRQAQVLGIAIDADCCRLVVAGLDGVVDEGRSRTVTTPKQYDQLLDALTAIATELMQQPQATTLGIGLSLPGLVDSRTRRSVLSPNVPITNGHSPADDLSHRLGVPCCLLQEQHALCLAEQSYGGAAGLNDFATLDITTGIGLGVMSGGRLLTGHAGLAGELGHITVAADGPRCGCGNRGCLETLASDSALLAAVNRRLGKRLSFTQVLAQVHAGRLNIDDELQAACRYLAIGIAAVVNLFNPATLFIHGRLLECDERLFDKLVKQVAKRALAPTLAQCRIVRALVQKEQGAVAGIIQQLTSAVGPTLEAMRP